MTCADGPSLAACRQTSLKESRKYDELTLVSLAWAILLASTVRAGEVGYVEDFALAKDRAASLRQLIPGTEDYYYYHCLHFLNTEQFEKVEEFTKLWRQRFGQTPRLTEIQTRYALLTYERNPERTLTYLRNHLNLQFNQQRTVLGAAPNLPTALDPKVISRSARRCLLVRPLAKSR